MAGRSRRWPQRGGLVCRTFRPALATYRVARAGADRPRAGVHRPVQHPAGGGPLVMRLPHTTSANRDHREDRVHLQQDTLTTSWTTKLIGPTYEDGTYSGT